MIDFSAFEQATPKDVLALLELFNACGFKAGVVGGIPRDFLLEAKVGLDFDLELRPADASNAAEEKLAEAYAALPKTLKEKGFRLREKGYKVWEVQLDRVSAEFTLPRVEVFNERVHHSNFEARHIADLDYSLGFKRRDFTVNAIMFEYWAGGWRQVDPLNGVTDLKMKLLRACDSGSFVKDPVRFLRAVRFQLAKNFALDPVLQRLLEHMEIAVSPHYFASEAVKSSCPLRFLLRCWELRPEVFESKFLAPWEEEIKEYEELFFAQDLKSHIAQALFLPANARVKAMQSFGLAAKGILELNLKEVNLGKVANMRVSEVARLSWARGLVDFLASARAWEPKKVDWLLQLEGAEFDAQFVQDYAELKLEPSENVPKKLLWADVLQRKVGCLKPRRA